MRELCVSGFQAAKLVKVVKKESECSLAYLIEQLSFLPAKSSGLLSRLAKTFQLRPKLPPLLIASRNQATSLSMNRDLLRANPGIRVLWMLRDPRDILTSIHADQPDEFYVKPERLITSLKLYDEFKDEPQIMTIHYEELVSSPNTVQARIAQAFQLETVRDFTEGHKYFPHFRQNMRAMHSIRPIDAKSVQKWRVKQEYKEYLETVLKEHPALISLAPNYGYELNLA